MLLALREQAGHGIKGKLRYKGHTQPLRHTPKELPATSQVPVADNYDMCFQFKLKFLHLFLHAAPLKIVTPDGGKC